MRLLFLLMVAALMADYAMGIYFFIDPGQRRCFVEHLPKHTVFLGNFSGTAYNEATKSDAPDPSTNVQISVEANGEIILNQLAGLSGRFFFTSSDQAEHLICLSTVQGSWFGTSKVKMSFEVFIGDPGETTITSPFEAKVSGLSQTIQQLNTLASDILREQNIHREREAQFRDLSEYVNSHVFWWALIQIIVLALTFLWQMRHLSSFFKSKKLV